MRKILTLVFCWVTISSYGQSVHFSQFFNAPLFTNPCNTGFSPDYDYRIGANYRNQWAALPVPFNTASAFADLKVGANRGVTDPNWLGIGVAVLSDKAGSGSLSLLQYQGSLAYHAHLSHKTVLSFGGAAAYVQRSVDFDALTYDNQWDGIDFNTRLPNGEKVGIKKTNFVTVAAGAALSYTPNDVLFIRGGLSINNINQPVETFYQGGTNTLKLRETGTLEVSYMANADFIITPAVYVSLQNGASEIIGGAMARYRLASARDAASTELILGGYLRAGDAAIGMIGLTYGGIQVVGSYDFTMSTLAPYNGSYGAMEISFVYGGPYYKNKGITSMFACPRFN